MERHNEDEGNLHVHVTLNCVLENEIDPVKKIHGGSGRICPRNAQKSPRKSEKRENLHRVECKTNFRVLFVCRQASKVAPEK